MRRNDIGLPFVQASKSVVGHPEDGDKTHRLVLIPQDCNACPNPSRIVLGEIIEEPPPIGINV
jgi:hypothetical protein